QAPGGGGAALLRNLARRAPRGGGRAAVPSVLSRLPVPPGVQVPPRASRASVPRVHRRGARACLTARAAPGRARDRCGRGFAGVGRARGERRRALVTSGSLQARVGELERRYLNGTFAELCRIESPSGCERRCAERVIAELRAVGVSAHEDDAGA